MWNNEQLPLFGEEAGEFVQIIKHADQIPRKPTILREIQLPRVGYQMWATNSDGTVATYAESRTPDDGCQRCFQEFPSSEGWTKHQIKNLETRQEFNCIEKRSDETTEHNNSPT